jgi:hypothetical protein
VPTCGSDLSDLVRRRYAELGEAIKQAGLKNDQDFQPERPASMKEASTMIARRFDQCWIDMQCY